MEADIDITAFSGKFVKPVKPLRVSDKSKDDRVARILKTSQALEEDVLDLFGLGMKRNH
jgi:hypothetical protein